MERLIPKRPVNIPFPTAEGNIPKREHWLSDKFADIASNNSDPCNVWKASSISCKGQCSALCCLYANSNSTPLERGG